MIKYSLSSKVQTKNWKRDLEERKMKYKLSTNVPYRIVIKSTHRQLHWHGMLSWNIVTPARNLLNTIIKYHLSQTYAILAKFPKGKTLCQTANHLVIKTKMKVMRTLVNFKAHHIMLIKKIQNHVIANQDKVDT